MKTKKYFFILLFSFTLSLFYSCVSNQNSDFNIVDENSIDIHFVDTNSVDKNSIENLIDEKNSDEKIFLTNINEIVNETKIDSIEIFKNAQENFRIKTIQSPAVGTKDIAFNKAYIFQIFDIENNPLPDYPLILRYPIAKNNDEVYFSKIKLLSDEKGFLSFMPEKPSFSYNSFIYLYPDIDEEVDNESLAIIENIIENESFKVAYQVKTNLMRAGGSLCLADYDKAGKVITTNGYSTSALLGAFIRNGFTGVGNLEFYKEIDNGNRDLLLQKVKKLTGSVSTYFVYGSIKYAKEPFMNENKQYEVNLDCEIYCVLLKTNEEIYHTKIQVTGLGNTEAAALNDARNNKMNTKLIEKIIYGM